MIPDVSHATPVWDAVVIGAGPAGSVAAMKLADAGLRVLLAERKKFPRDKVCGGCLNARALAVLHDLGLQRVAQEANGQLVHQLSVRAGSRSLNLTIPTGMAICRSEFDHGLFQEAAACGVQCVTGVAARVVPTSPQIAATTPTHEVQLESDGGVASTVQTRIVVLAGGLQSASYAAPHLLTTRIASASRIGVGAILDAASNELIAGTVSMNTVFMNVAAAGYAGAVRLADGRLIVAAALDREFVRQSGNVSAAVQAIFAVNGWKNSWPADPPIFHGTPQLTRALIRPAAHRLFVIGDAASYIEPFTGEGMASALVTAVGVVPYVVRAVKCWESSLVEEWTHEHRRLIHYRDVWCRVFAALLRRPWLTQLAAFVSGHWPQLPPMIARRVVGQPMV